MTSPPTIDTSDFVPRREGVRLFVAAGFSSSTFDREARKHITTRPQYKGEQGPRGRRYSLSDIKKVLFARTGREKVITPPFAFRRMTVEDMPNAAHLLGEAFGVEPNIEAWQDRIRANEEIGYVVTSGGVIQGCGFLMPHTEEWILHLLTQDMTPITYPQDILPFVPGEPVCLYVRTVAVRQNGISKAVSHRWASVLIAGLLRTVVQWGARGIVIDRVYGRSDTKDGERMLHKLGFTRIETMTSHENFVVDVRPSGLRFMKQYKKALLLWEKQHKLREV